MNDKKQDNKNKGITLIALVITIIVLLILAGVSMAMLTGENGILNQATKAKEETEKAKQKELANLDKIEDYITENTNGNYIKTKGVNSPKLASGMTKIMFTDPTDSEKGKMIKTGEDGFNNSNWFDYTNKKWANVITEDGSMWVWIPRYAYKITYQDSSDKSQGGTIDVKFLIGTSDQYYEGNELKTAKRATSKDEIVDTTSDYYVHPAFTNESNIDYANGGWDKELTGIWVAKFEAGYASGNNNAPVKASSKNYTQTTGWVSAVEAGTDTDSTQPARNWLDGIYGETTTAIKYPTFQGTTYSMNYINHNDAFSIMKVLTEEGNIYGLKGDSTDSHLMKNSEWGAVAYLAQSQYGLNGNDININNITLNSGGQKKTETEGQKGVESVYAVTGVTTGSNDAELKVSNISMINATSGNSANGEVYTWNQKNGQGASSSGTIYGIYDLSGGCWERTAAYVANGDATLKAHGASIAYDGNTLKTSSTKYTMVYPHSSPESTDLDVASNENHKINTKIFGDAIRETSKSGIGSTSWYKDYSYFTAYYGSFSVRGGDFGYKNSAGLFYYTRSSGGDSSYGSGLRAVLIND